MKLEECFEIASEFKALYSKLGFTDGGETYINTYIDQSYSGPCSNIDEYKEFAVKINNEQIRNVLLNDYNKIDFEWDRFAANYEPTEIYAKANVEININGEIKKINLRLEVYL